MSRRASAPLCCGLTVAALLSATVASGSVPATQRLEPTGLGLSFSMPSDWAGAEGSASGLRYEVAAPGRVVLLEIYTAKTSESLSGLASQLVAFAQQQYAGSKDLSVTSKVTTLRLNTAAVEVNVRYHGLWSDTASVGEIHHDIYLILHAGVLYEFDYGGIDPWASRDAAVIAASAKSIRFGLVA